jgi:lysylphosphatidylglycerol synthetase-like protein (DUF2156 family)
MKKLKTLIMVVISLGVFLAPVSTSAAVYAQATDPKTAVCEGVGLTGGTGCGDAVQANTSVSNIVRNVINILSIAVGIIAVIMIMIGGLRYVTSGGDSNSVNGAKNTILYAVIGLVIALLAQVIVRFVITKATTPPPQQNQQNNQQR